MKSAGNLNGTFYIEDDFLTLFVTRFPFLCAVSSIVHEAALPKAKQHGMKAAKAKREEMLKQAHTAEEIAAAKEKAQMDGAHVKT